MYLDWLLPANLKNDPQTIEMLQIIKGSARFLYDGFAPSILGMVQSKHNSYASSYYSSLPSYQENLADMREMLAE